ncbi:E3 ubiquitin-protein ligase TRIM71-like [Amphiura filiformis]|uniref:E3 ubiquitin-protein ligase TRIM71-like n=1 Tax=Amphiura filiformis TaxID=82378 RepID=UPI003B20D852
MAESNLPKTKDLTQCGICLLVIEEPKALPCLHSFCLKCLTKWAEGRKVTVMCPLCRQDFPIPTEGVKGFITNFVINTLKDRQEMAEKLQSKDARFVCSCCKATETNAEAFCADCCGFICQECGMRHKKVVIMQSHKTFPFVELQSGKVDIKSVMRQEHCKKHKGQILEFYCKTCDVLVCVGCTVVDHSGHTLVNLQSATDEQRSEIKYLTIDCRKVSQVVEKSLKCVDKVRYNLQKSEKKAKDDLLQAAEELRKQVLAEIRQKEIDMEAQITLAAAENIKQIDAQMDSLQLQQTRFETALQMASEVTQTGSDHDLALVFSSLKSSLRQLGDMTAEDVDETLGKIEFTRSRCALSPMPNLGSLSVGSKKEATQARHTTAMLASGSDTKASPVSPSTLITKVRSSANVSGIGSPVQGVQASVQSKTMNDGTWKLSKQFGSGQLSRGRDIAITSGGDFIVTDSDKGSVLHFLSQSGTLKRKLDISQGLKSVQASRPWNIVVSTDGRIFTTQWTSDVNVYDANGTFKYQFVTRSPSNVSCTAQNAERLMGLAIDNQGCVLVGECTRKYISKHSLDGSHISSIKVPIPPVYLTVTPHDHIIVSSGWGGTAHILDTRGNILHTISRPSAVSCWQPYGICYTPDDDIYLANCASGSDGGIYRYSSSGQYLGCIIKDVDVPACLTLCDDGNTLAVVEVRNVKVFSRQ